MPNAINTNLKYSKKNPQQDIELLKKIGSGTYGEVYQVRWNILSVIFVRVPCFVMVCIFYFCFAWIVCS